MDNVYYEPLSEQCRSLVGEIEAATERPIRVGARGDDGYGCGFGRFDGIIYVPMEGVLTDDSAFHELTHLHRCLVQLQPRLEPFDELCEVEFEWQVHHLDNNLEHICIVPDEIAARPQRLDFWRELIGRRIGEARLGHTDAVTIGALIFAGNLGASLETSLGKFARRNLPGFQLEEAVRGLLANIGDKRLALELLAVAGVPLERIKLVRYVPGRGWQDDR